MTEPRIDWGLACAARLTHLSSTRSGAKARIIDTPSRPTDAQVVAAMARGEFASEFAGRRVLLSMIGRLVGVAVIALVVAIIAGIISVHTRQFAPVVVKTAGVAVMVFAGTLAILMDRRWRQMARRGTYPRRRSTLVVPLVLGILAGGLVVVAQLAH